MLAEIIRKTDGIPLFVEELTKTVLQSGLLEDTPDGYELKGALPPLAIPSTLQDSLMARLDRLAPAKEVAQVSALIGREFSLSPARRGAADARRASSTRRSTTWCAPSSSSAATRRPMRATASSTR